MRLCSLAQPSIQFLGFAIILHLNEAASDVHLWFLVEKVNFTLESSKIWVQTVDSLALS